MRTIVGGRVGAALTIPLGLVAVVVHVPAALAFPYYARFGATTVYAERPIGPGMANVLHRADTLLATSPINRPGIVRQIVLTDGGWRWQVMALGTTGAIALRRPFSTALIFNRSDIAHDRVSNDAAIGGVRTLSGTIAHETTHLLVARNIGEWRAMMLPVWKREGYPDFVARETSVGKDDEGKIRALDPTAGVLAYYDGRRRVAAVLQRNGGSVDALLAE